MIAALATPAEVEAALLACATEPIHTPGSIQELGVLIVTDLGVGRVSHVSHNCVALLGCEAARALGSDPAALLPAELSHALRGAAGLSSLREQREYLGRFQLNGSAIHASVSANPGQLLIELEPAATEEVTVSGEVATRHLITRHRRYPGLVPLLDAAARGLRELLGYDRVMAYAFLPEGDGEVVAEAVRHGLTPYLGLRYPASDIPPQARALYLRAPLRVIGDSRASAVPIVSREHAPLDLSLTQLRAVSPVHLTYLQNMEVAASLSIAIVVDGALWGLLACHHGSPRVPNAQGRAAAELYGQMLSLLVSRQLEQDQRAARERAEVALSELIATADTQSWGSKQRVSELLLAIVPADGVVYSSLEGEHMHSGLTPTPEVALAVQEHALRSADDVLANSELSSLLDLDGAALRGVAGVLVVKPAPLHHPMQIQFYRRGRVEEARWGGNPEKTLVQTDAGLRLHPRASFAEYRSERGGRARPWTQDDLARARSLSQIVLRLLARDARESRERTLLLEGHRQRQDLLVAELNHRVKNVLGLIRSIVRQSAGASGDVSSYAADLEQRLKALAVAHDLAARQHMNAVDLRALVLAELSPYRAGDARDASVIGPSIALRAEVVPTLALVLHELISNAAKYGALSTPVGTVSFRWQVDELGLSIHYEERDGPLVAPPERRGFGRTLIERGIPYELDGRSTLVLATEGARFDAFIPRKHLHDAPSPPERSHDSRPPPPRAASDARVLVVEDNLLLASELDAALRAAGCSAVACAATVATALGLLDEPDFDAAVLDVNLRGELSYAVAERLRELGVPFVFLTGYGAELAVPEALRDAPRLTKPVDEARLISFVLSLAANRRVF